MFGVWFVTALMIGDVQKPQADAATVSKTLPCLRQIDPGIGAVHAIALDKNGERIAIGGDRGQACVVSLTSGEVLARLPTEPLELDVWDVAFDPSGRHLVTVQYGAARVWNAETYAHERTLRGQKLGMAHARFSPDGKRLVTDSSMNGREPNEATEARVWDPSNGELIATIDGQRSRVHSSFRPDGLALLVGCEGKSTARIFDLEQLRFDGELKGHDLGLAQTAWSPDGKWLLTVSSDRTGRLWDAATGARTAELRGHEGFMLACEFSADSKQALTTSWQDRTSRVWNVSTGKLRCVLAGPEERVLDAHFSPDGRAVASVDALGHGFLFELEKGTLFARFEGHTALIAAVRFTPDGKRLVTGSRDGSVRVWANPLAK